MIGGGNVAADIARVFIKDPDELADTPINPRFLDFLRFDGPRVVRIFIRSAPWNVKMSLKELNELRDTGVWMSAQFDYVDYDDDALTDEQRAVMAFFAGIR